MSDNIPQDPPLGAPFPLSGSPFAAASVLQGQPPRPIAFTGVRLIDPATGRDEMGGLLIKDGRIEAVSSDLYAPEGLSFDYTRIDGEDRVLAPGLIDMTVTAGEPGAEHKETLASASRSAAAGGVTTIILMPDTDPVIDDAALVDFIARRARDTAIVRVEPMAALTQGLAGEQMSEMALLKDAGAIAFTEGRKSIANARVMRRALEYAKTIDGLIAHFAEDADLAGGGLMNEGELATRLGLTGIPAVAESIIVERDLALVNLTGGRYHLSQVTCSESLVALAKAKDRGLPVSCAVTPHHLALNEVDIATYRTFAKTKAPLRSEDVRLELLEALRSGLIDVVASHHDPRGPEEKRLPYAEAAFGTVGLESLLPILLGLVQSEHIDLIRALHTVTVAPARLLGLDSGRLKIGAPADLALIDPELPFVFNRRLLKSKSKNSPFDRRHMQGRAVMTLVGGRVVYDFARDEALHEAGGAGFSGEASAGSPA